MRRLATGGDRHEAPADFIFGRETKGFEDALDLLAHLRHVLLERQRNHCDTPWHAADAAARRAEASVVRTHRRPDADPERLVAACDPDFQDDALASDTNRTVLERSSITLSKKVCNDVPSISRTYEAPPAMNDEIPVRCGFYVFIFTVYSLSRVRHMHALAPRVGRSVRYSLYGH